MKKFLAGSALTAVALGGMVAMAPAASAHIPNTTADCNGLNVDLKQYHGGSIEVVIDDKVVDSTEFPGGSEYWSSFVKQYPFEDDTVEHTWSVTVDAYDDDQYDYADQGSVAACATPPAKETAVPATPEVVAGCAVSMDDVVLPENSDTVSYSKNDAGVVAALVSDNFEWIKDLGAWTPQNDGSVLFPADLLLVEEKCEEAPTPQPSPSVSTETEPSGEPSTPSAEEEPPVLAATGATVGGAATFALLLVGGGVALVIARRRMARN
ncbi:hypothetical protein [Myceligenerans indicum]|uniref:DUF4366 domain-containing protein n=1 Tax=Myceligenerans indicum TaxID=2593663 RepID=A0ABS1LMV7_9MICO|nr:hypothetical protein [Myceligenerans indicum]MBL0887364.1 DUF4366 domain-containing protein [Myceligenerans indicum]